VKANPLTFLAPKQKQARFKNPVFSFGVAKLVPAVATTSRMLAVPLEHAADAELPEWLTGTA